MLLTELAMPISGTPDFFVRVSDGLEQRPVRIPFLTQSRVLSLFWRPLSPRFLVVGKDTHYEDKNKTNNGDEGETDIHLFSVPIFLIMPFP
jgi:hypothetical protein